MKVIHIIGHPDAGKTTLTARVITEAVHQGIKVGSIKHSAHAHELDRPGKDSFLHRKAGASPAAMITPDLAAVYLPREDGGTCESLLQTLYSHLDLVIVEGWISGPYDKIEIWRAALNKPPLFLSVPAVRAFVTDYTGALEAALETRADTPPCFSGDAVRQITAFLINDL